MERLLLTGKGGQAEVTSVMPSAERTRQDSPVVVKEKKQPLAKKPLERRGEAPRRPCPLKTQKRREVGKHANRGGKKRKK